eukprot:symbB.v1.2.030217.t1/scaffold3380.1/size79486/3
MRRWILHAHSVLGLSLADECFGSVCAVDDMDQDLFKAFDPSVEEDAGSLQLLQVARVASSELLKSSTSGRSLQVESTNSTSSLEMTLPASWWQETMRAAISGRTMTPILILVGLALGLGMLILVVLQWLDAKKSSQRRGQTIRCLWGHSQCAESVGVQAFFVLFVMVNESMDHRRVHDLFQKTTHSFSKLVPLHPRGDGLILEWVQASLLGPRPPLQSFWCQSAQALLEVHHSLGLDSSSHQPGLAGCQFLGHFGVLESTSKRARAKAHGDQSVRGSQSSLL